MRLIIKDYISCLKEKDELDLLISNIFSVKGYLAESQPKTGNRQYGVDIQMQNSTEILLFVVKQGDIDRNKWDSNQNSVRQSLNEILDVYISLMPQEEIDKKISVIVATNGYIDEAVKPNWNGFQKNNIEKNGINISFKFYGIDEIVSDIVEYFFNENIFTPELRSPLRKSMYLIDDDDDYNQKFYEHIIDTLITKLNDKKQNNNKKEKLWNTMYMASQMIAQYAADASHCNISIRITEYCIIKFWLYIKKNSLFEKQKAMTWLNKLLNRYEYWNDLYLTKIQKIISDEARLPFYGIVENRVILYEILGYMSTYGNYLFYRDKKRSRDVLNAIIQLINRYKYFEYAPYDKSVSIMIMIVKLLCLHNRKDQAEILMYNQICKTVILFRNEKKYPAPSDTFEEAVKIQYKLLPEDSKYTVSGFWGYYLLMIAKLDLEKMYMELKDFLMHDLSEVTKCIWFLNQEQEDALYSPGAMNLSGEGIELEVRDSYLDFRDRIMFITNQYKDVYFSFDLYCFPALEFIICRYYDYIPRVQ